MISVHVAAENEMGMEPARAKDTFQIPALLAVLSEHFQIGVWFYDSKSGVEGAQLEQG